MGIVVTPAAGRVMLERRVAIKEGVQLGIDVKAVDIGRAKRIVSAAPCSSNSASSSLGIGSLLKTSALLFAPGL